MGENHCRVARKLWKETLFFPTGGFGLSDSPRCQLKDMKSLLQQCHREENRSQERCVNAQMLVTSCIHLWPNFYLTLRCTHSPGLLWRQPPKLRTITAPPCVSLGGSCWCSSGIHVFKGIYHMQQYLTWPLLPQNPNLPLSSLSVSLLPTLLLALDWHTILELFRVLFLSTNSQSHSRERRMWFCIWKILHGGWIYPHFTLLKKQFQYTQVHS